MKKANIFVAIGFTIAIAFLFFSEGDKNIKAIVAVIVIGLGIALAFSIVPKQEGAIKKAITLVKVGFAIALPGWLIAAFGGKAGVVLFLIGGLILGTGMAIGFWNFPLPKSQRYGGIGLKVFVIGFVIFGGGLLLGAIGVMEDEVNIFSKVGISVCCVGMLGIWLGVLEDHMH